MPKQLGLKGNEGEGKLLKMWAGTALIGAITMMSASSLCAQQAAPAAPTGPAGATSAASPTNATTSASDAPLKGDAMRAKDKISMCIGCHGIPYYHTAYPEVYHVPMIAGQNAGYIISALKAYRSGEREHPSMRGIASSLSDQDIADLAAYYSAGVGLRSGFFEK